VHVAILGNGIAGVTAARRLRAKRPEVQISIVSGESRHHYSRPALMYVYMGHMRYEHVKPFPDDVWEKWRLELVEGWVGAIDLAKKELVFDARGNGGRPPLAFDRLVLATGSRTNKFGWPGQDLKGVQGLYGLGDLELLEENTRRCKRAVIVGGGLIGIELAEMLRSRGIAVTFLVRESSYWNNVLPAEESAMVNRVILREGVGLRLSTQLSEIVDDGQGRCCAVVTDRGERIACDFVGLTPGVSPNAELAKSAGLRVGRGVLVDESFRTSAPEIFAAGDCAEIVAADGGANRVEQLWYTGRLQGEVLGDVLAGEERRYDRGIWFNSAKFFDLEYQTYGLVGMSVPGERNLYWEAGDGLHAVRIVHTPQGVIGFNVMGIRYRQAVCERWIRERRPIGYVLEHLHEANFDPEFFRRCEGEIARAFRGQLA
jgi:NADPH-dependent 2,4-dienoyl-CoA reductase/sulfur reductase-like enzyme